MKNFHLPLPEDVYAALREEAAALQRPATVIAREAIDAWLRERRRASVRKSIAAYAVKHEAPRPTSTPTSRRRRRR
jgi:predicted transcriptional regulator